MDEIRETEKYFCEYIFLGLPKKPFRCFLNFRLKKGSCPTLYAEKLPFWIRLFGLVEFIPAASLERDGLALDLLTRHAEKRRAKRITLIPAPAFMELVKRNSQRLESIFLIKNSEDI